MWRRSDLVGEFGWVVDSKRLVAVDVGADTVEGEDAGWVYAGFAVIGSDRVGVTADAQGWRFEDAREHGS